MDIDKWEHHYYPTLNGEKLSLEPYESSRSLAIASDAKSFLLGTDWSLYRFDADGSKHWRQSVPEVAWAVNISADMRLAAAAFADGTIRWYRYSDGQPLLIFFPHKDKKRWVVWTPSGYYAASVGGDDLIGWHLNHGRDRAADFFPASRFREQFYRPDVVQKILTTLDEEKALEAANAESGKRSRQTDIKKILPPVVHLLSPKPGSGFSAKEITLRYRLETPSGEPVTRLKALVDGVSVSVPKAVVRKKKGEGSLAITVPSRDCEVSLIAENRYAASTPASVRLKWQGKRNTAAVLLPDLYLLAIGVGDYSDKSLRLDFPAKDADDFAGAMKKQEGRLYRKVTPKMLTNQQATKGNILDAFDWLEKETTSKDVAILYISGHGENDHNGDYYYLPQDVNPDKLRRTAIAWIEVKNFLSNLAGKRLLFVDTCRSGGVMGRKGGPADIDAIVNELRSAENGVIVFASSTARQYSLENPSWNNGAFTKALVEGLTGKGDLIKDGSITINELNTYIADRVKQLTGGKQTPTLGKPSTVPDFPIAVK